MPKKTNFYQRLGISQNASLDEIKRAFRQAAQRLHPDVNKRPGATEHFLDIKEAYEVLIDPDVRAEYDKTNKPEQQKKRPIRVNTQYSRSAIRHSKEKQLLYALLDISILPGSEPIQKSAPAINVALVLDTSTSMKGNRINTVKATAIELVRQLREHDFFSIVTFNDKADILFSTNRSTKSRKAENRIRSLHPSGGTEIFRGLEAGLKQVQKHHRPSGISHIFLITDGHTYGDEQACKRLADEAARAGIGLSSLGIGDQWNDNLLDDLAVRTGGDCIYIQKPPQIQSLLTKKLRQLEQAYAKQIQLEFKTGPAISLQYAFRLKPEIGGLDTESPFQLGNLAKNNQQRILLEFMIDPIPDTIETVLIMAGSFQFQIPSQSLKRFETPITLTRPAQSQAPTKQLSPVLQEALSNLTLYRMQEQAQIDIEQGNYQQATKRLGHVATHLFSRGEQELAHTVLAEAEHINDYQQFSPEGRKEIKYGTRALLLPGKEITGDLSS